MLDNNLLDRIKSLEKSIFYYKIGFFIIFQLFIFTWISLYFFQKKEYNNLEKYFLTRSESCISVPFIITKRIDIKGDHNNFLSIDPDNYLSIIKYGRGNKENFQSDFNSFYIGEFGFSSQNRLKNMPFYQLSLSLSVDTPALDFYADNKKKSLLFPPIAQEFEK